MDAFSQHGVVSPTFIFKSTFICFLNFWNLVHLASPCPRFLDSWFATGTVGPSASILHDNKNDYQSWYGMVVVYTYMVQPILYWKNTHMTSVLISSLIGSGSLTGEGFLLCSGYNIGLAQYGSFQGWLGGWVIRAGLNRIFRAMVWRDNRSSWSAGSTWVGYKSARMNTSTSPSSSWVLYHRVTCYYTTLHLS